jgi:hypothetical protein
MASIGIAEERLVNTDFGNLDEVLSDLLNHDDPRVKDVTELMRKLMPIAIGWLHERQQTDISIGTMLQHIASISTSLALTMSINAVPRDEAVLAWTMVLKMINESILSAISVEVAKHVLGGDDDVEDEAAESQPDSGEPDGVGKC